jgi:hypothetical protein
MPVKTGIQNSMKFLDSGSRYPDHDQGARDDDPNFEAR